MVAVDDDQRPRRRLNLREPGRQVAEGDERGAGQGGDGMLLGLAHVEEVDRLTGFQFVGKLLWVDLRDHAPIVRWRTGGVSRRVEVPAACGLNPAAYAAGSPLPSPNSRSQRSTSSGPTASGLPGCDWRCR